MMERVSVENIKSLEHIRKSILAAFFILRSSIIINESNSIILFLLTLHKEGFTNGLTSLDNLHLKFQGASSPDSKSKYEDSLNEALQKRLSGIFKEIDDELSYSIINISSQELYDILKIFETFDQKLFVEKFAQIFDEALLTFRKFEGKYSDEYFQPVELTKFITGLVKLPKNANVYNPFAGVASYGIALEDNCNYIGQEINFKNWAIGTLRLKAHNRCGKAKIILGDSINNWLGKNEKFDLIISTPPFGLKRDLGTEDRPFKAVEADLIQNSINSLKPDGKLIVVVPLRFLTDNPHQSLRRKLISLDNLDKVIAFPEGLLFSTGTPFALLVIDQQKSSSGKTAFINTNGFIEKLSKGGNKLDHNALLRYVNNNTEDDSFKWVNNDEIKLNEYSFLPSRYFIFEELKNAPYPLEELGRLINLIPKEIVNSEAQGLFIRIGDLATNPFSSIKDFSEVDVMSIPQNASILKENSLMLSLVGNDLKPTYFKKSYETVYYSSNYIVAYTINTQKVDIEYLLYELFSEYVSRQIKSFKGGSTIPYITKNDLLKVRIKLPSLEQQKEIVLSRKTEFVLTEEKKLEKLKVDISINKADQDSLLRHRIRGKVRNVKSFFKILKAIIDQEITKEIQNPYKLQAESSNRSLGESLQILERDIESIYQAVDSAGREIELKDAKMERIDLVHFVSQYCSELEERKTKPFKLTFNNIDEDLLENGTVKIFINGDTGLLTEMFNNLVENAEKHAFNNSYSIKNHLYVDLLLNFDFMEAQLDFSNTGIPLTSLTKWGNAVKKGTCAGLYAGKGIGLWHVNEIMKIHGGSLEFTDETQDSIGKDLVSTFELYFPIEIEKDDESTLV